MELDLIGTITVVFMLFCIVGAFWCSIELAFDPDGTHPWLIRRALDAIKRRVI